jgi:quinoprotein glucose dehydrogenase
LAGDIMRIVTFILLFLTGLGMALPGLYLASLGGSLYYEIAGVLIVIAAILVLRGSQSGIHLFWLVFLGTVAWSIWEVGLDGWALLPRLVYLAAAALWLLMLAPRHHVPPARLATSGFAASLLAVIGLSGALGLWALNRGASAQPAAAPMAAEAGAGEWAHYGSSLHGTRYSQLAQITPANAANLEEAWTYHSGFKPLGKLSADQLEDTPLMVDGMLYGCTGQSAVFALDPVTGKQLWRYDTKLDPDYGGRGVCRGVSFFRGKFLPRPRRRERMSHPHPVRHRRQPAAGAGRQDRHALPRLRQGWRGRSVGRRGTAEIRQRLDQSHFAAHHRAWHGGDRRLHRRQRLGERAAGGDPRL